MEIGESSQPLARDDLIFRQVDDDFFVYDPVADQVVLLNVSAAVVLDLCDGTRTPDEIASAVARTFGTDLAEVVEEVRATLQQLDDSTLFGSVSKAE